MLRLFMVMLLFSGPAAAVEYDEMLDDPVLETRAQQLDEQIRCVVCRSEVIASSNADWARDARLMVRERVLAGDSDAEVLGFFVQRYGDFVLMDPRLSGVNILLWAAGPTLLVLGAALFWRLRHAQGQSATSERLSAEEEAQIDRILMEDP